LAPQDGHCKISIFGIGKPYEKLIFHERVEHD